MAAPVMALFACGGPAPRVTPHAVTSQASPHPPPAAPTAGTTPPSATTSPSSSAPSPTATLLAELGSTGAFVVGLQLRLDVAADGSYGPVTAEAVRSFQVTHRLPGSGVVDSATWAVLRTVPSACPSPAEQPVTRAPGTGKTVALTFDDGPSEYVPAILSVLARFHVSATFFDTGAADVARPDLARAIVAAGDVLGNHTYDHPRNWGYAQYVSAGEQARELAATNDVQAPLLGHSPCVMRPPGGAYDEASLALVRSYGMSLVMWSNHGDDWQQPPYLSAHFQQHVVSDAEQGVRLAHPILLLHAGKASQEPDCSPTGCAPGQVSSFRGNTVAALPVIIAFYLGHGYRFVTL